MPGGKSLGFFEGEKELYLVQTAGSAFIRSTAVPLPVDEEKEPSGPIEIRLTALIQKTIRLERVNINQVKVAVPTKEILVRSFTIPVMRQSEIDAGIEFEIKKHMPFNLEDLIYSYHCLPITQDNVKKILIVFAAIQHSYLLRYIKILEQAGLSVVFSEPAPFSLVRALLAKKILSDQQQAAVLQMEGLLGRILFLYEGTIIFMREFSLNAPVKDDTVVDEVLLRNRLTNEVHNSLEFYNRQYSQQIQQILVLSSPQDPYGEWLQTDLSVAIKLIDMKSITGLEAADQIGVINAFGVALANEVKTKFIFDFSHKKPRKQPLFRFPQVEFDISDYKKAIQIGVGCAILLIGIFTLTQVGLLGVKKSVDDLSSLQGQYASQSADEIKAQIEENETKLKDYKVLPIKSYITEVFVYIPMLLPQGVWLEGLALKSGQAKDKSGQVSWSLDLSGNAYTDDPNQEISLVYELVSRIKKDKNLAKYFKTVTLTRLQRQEINNKTIISFHLICA